MPDDDVPVKRVDSAEAFIAYTLSWIEENEADLERLAAETGKTQERTIGIRDDTHGRTLLQVRLTCEPREFAKRTVEGELAAAFPPSR
jgi:hypothetical protein